MTHPANRSNPPSFFSENLFPLRATETPIEQPRELAEKLFLKIKACFTTRDKGGHGDVHPDRETDFPPQRIAAPPLRPHLAVEPVVMTQPGETSMTDASDPKPRARFRPPAVSQVDVRGFWGQRVDAGCRRAAQHAVAVAADLAPAQVFAERPRCSAAPRSPFPLSVSLACPP